MIVPATRVTCNGQGDSGDHCCYIGGVVCEFLDTKGAIPRCSVWDEMDSPKWKQARVGKYFAERFPGYTCRDWPQNIPEVMEAGIGLCCWRGDR